MKPQRIVVAILALLALLFLAWLLLAPDGREVETLSGYVEGETLYLASPVAGSVAELGVRRGQRVAAGQRLFVVAPGQREAQGEQARADVEAAQALAEDARKGQRPVELGILEAEREAAAAAARETRIQLDRTAALVRRGIFARVRLDDARAAHETTAARLTAATRRLEAARLGQREDEIRAADARAALARARQSETAERIDDMAPRAPSAGRIEEVFYQRGEWAAANQPIVAMIPDGRVRVRFFVPQAQVAAYRPGRRVRFRCDGCPAGLEAAIAFVSPRPEFTPPIIYSRESRDRLVFMVEALPAADAQLVPGLPVDVIPIGADR
ncbi:HlyD family secretion protein [Sphingosinicella terrae]|uniref:HlyD family secretion protein n=1 Tax=Sphingosinicella terrae TaxID=2172047 RepID=UPI000E0CC2E4|nr:HlyD family efflux transporter periplasmic adaptor subunit [Sphingosinicella terrae]